MRKSRIFWLGLISFLLVICIVYVNGTLTALFHILLILIILFIVAFFIISIVDEFIITSDEGKVINKKYNIFTIINNYIDNKLG